MKRRLFVFLSLFVLLSVILVACGGDEPEELTPVRVQLQWVAQSQFAGYYAALAEGYYEDEGLDVTILEGAPDIVPQQV
jgi:NitT/TauT family transport system substrate-binding protein